MCEGGTILARTALYDFLSGVTGSLTGTLQGQAAGAEAARARAIQQQQLAAQRQAQSIAQFQALAGIEHQQNEDAMAPFELGLKSLPLLTPQGKADVLQGGFNQYAHRPPTQYNAAALAQLIATGKMPVSPTPSPQGLPVQPPTVQQAAAWGAPGGAPQVPQQPAFAYDPGAAMGGGIPFVPAQPATPGAITATGALAAPAAPVAPAQPVVHTQFGDLTVSGGVDRARLGRIQSNYATLGKAYRDLPEDDPRREKIRQVIAQVNSTNGLNPEDDASADATERMLSNALFTYAPETGAGKGTASRISGLKPAREAVVASWDSLKDLSDPDDMLTVIESVLADTNALTESAKSVKQPVGLPAGLAASLPDMKRVVELRNSQDPKDQQKARELAAGIRERINIKLDPKVENQYFNSTLKALEQLDPNQPGYETQKKQIVARSKVAYRFPTDLGGFGTARLDEEWQKEFAQIPRWGEMPAAARAALVGRLGTLSRLLGRPFELSAADIQKSDPKTKLEIDKLRNEVKMQGTRAQILNTTLDIDKVRYQSDKLKLANLKAGGGTGAAKGLLTENSAAREYSHGVDRAWNSYQAYLKENPRTEEQINNPDPADSWAVELNKRRAIYEQAKKSRDTFFYNRGWDISTGKPVPKGSQMPAQAPETPQKQTAPTSAAPPPAEGWLDKTVKGVKSAVDAVMGSQPPPEPGAKMAQKPRPTRAQAAAYIRSKRPNVSPADLTAALDAAGY